MQGFISSCYIAGGLSETEGVAISLVCYPFLVIITCRVLFNSIEKGQLLIEVPQEAILEDAFFYSYFRPVTRKSQSNMRGNSPITPQLLRKL